MLFRCFIFSNIVIFSMIVFFMQFNKNSYQRLDDLLVRNV